MHPHSQFVNTSCDDSVTTPISADLSPTNSPTSIGVAPYHHGMGTPSIRSKRLSGQGFHRPLGGVDTRRKHRHSTLGAYGNPSGMTIPDSLAAHSSLESDACDVTFPRLYTYFEGGTPKLAIPYILKNGTVGNPLANSAIAHRVCWRPSGPVVIISTPWPIESPETLARLKSEIYHAIYQDPQH